MNHTFRLYVVELDPAVLLSGRFRRSNPGLRPDRGPCLYVGSTAKTAEERYAQHKAGIFCNRGWVTKFGRRLRHDLAPSISYQTRQSAELAERDLAEHLRKEGYAVWSR